MPHRNTILDFERKYIPEPNSGCWLWLGASPNRRYGALSWNGRRILAHVLSYKIFKGAIPVGKVIDHLCKTTLCVNPAHLEAVTQRTNMRRGREATKTHCLHGHPYADGWEQYAHAESGRTYRRCLTCYKMRYPGSAK